MATPEFSLARLRELSAAATPGPWATRGADSSIPQRIYRDFGGNLEDGVAHGMEFDGSHRLIAYLGTHRDRIIALIDAADAMYDAVEVAPSFAVLTGQTAEDFAKDVHATAQAYDALRGER